ncbi:MAG TPA: four helix bundle protein [Opitutaceae bacterium]|nr:four helix bundle protein [Opitutaceae bacterium]
MTKTEMLQRTKAFALRVIKAVRALPEKDDVAGVLGRQLLRSGTSVGANYRAVCRAKSTADFINKLKIVEEECDESLYWMELLVESGSMVASRLEALMQEADELLAITVAALRTTRLNRKSEVGKS